MNVIRFSDLIAAGKVAGQRVFIRADLNVPQDDNGRITEDTRIRASLPAIKMALDAGYDPGNRKNWLNCQRSQILKKILCLNKSRSGLKQPLDVVFSDKPKSVSQEGGQD